MYSDIYLCLYVFTSFLRIYISLNSSYVVIMNANADITINKEKICIDTEFMNNSNYFLFFFISSYLLLLLYIYVNLIDLLVYHYRRQF